MNAIGIFSTIEPCERVVDATFVLRPERLRLRRLAEPRPVPGSPPERSRGEQDAADREGPGGQVEPVRLRRRQHGRPELRPPPGEGLLLALPAGGAAGGPPPP